MMSKRLITLQVHSNYMFKKTTLITIQYHMITFHYLKFTSNYKFCSKEVLYFSLSARFAAIVKVNFIINYYRLIESLFKFKPPHHINLNTYEKHNIK